MEFYHWELQLCQKLPKKSRNLKINSKMVLYCIVFIVFFCFKHALKRHRYQISCRADSHKLYLNANDTFWSLFLTLLNKMMLWSKFISLEPIEVDLALQSWITWCYRTPSQHPPRNTSIGRRQQPIIVLLWAENPVYRNRKNTNLLQWNKNDGIDYVSHPFSQADSFSKNQAFLIVFMKSKEE